MLIAILAATLAKARPLCLDISKPVNRHELVGKLSRKHFFSEGTEVNPSGLERPYALRLARSICVRGNSYIRPSTQVRDVEVFSDDPKIERKLALFRHHFVRVFGSIEPTITVHQYGLLQITADRIALLPPQTSAYRSTSPRP